ncbi:LysR substrate-binding domain-containing protein [Devosia enhydra]|nr:LysR substrate-binding domain-containing protein [Devosia enhydra]
MQDLNETTVTHLVVGMSPTAAYRLVPLAVSRLMRRRPKLTVRLVEAGKPMLMADLLAGATDMFIAMKNPSEVLPGIVITDLFSDEFVLMVRAGHPLTALSPPLGPKALGGFGWVLPDIGGILRMRFDEWLQREGVPLAGNVISTASISATKALALTSDRIAAGPVHAFERELREGSLARLGGTWSTMQREFSLYRRAQAEDPPIVVLFLSMLRELLREIPSLQPLKSPIGPSS